MDTYVIPLSVTHIKYIIRRPFLTFFLHRSSDEILNFFIRFRLVNAKFADHKRKSFIFIFISDFFHEQD